MILKMSLVLGNIDWSNDLSSDYYWYCGARCRSFSRRSIAIVRNRRNIEEKSKSHSCIFSLLIHLFASRKKVPIEKNETTKKSFFSSLLEPPEFEISNYVLELAYTQTLCWLVIYFLLMISSILFLFSLRHGLLFSPFFSLIAALKKSSHLFYQIGKSKLIENYYFLIHFFFLDVSWRWRFSDENQQSNWVQRVHVTYSTRFCCFHSFGHYYRWLTLLPRSFIQ